MGKNFEITVARRRRRRMSLARISLLSRIVAFEPDRQRDAQQHFLVSKAVLSARPSMSYRGTRPSARRY
jgi:hypothetical protein